MADIKRRLEVEIIAVADKFAAGMGTAGKSLAGFENTLGRTFGQFDKSKQGLDNIGRAASAVQVPLLAGGAALTAFGAAGVGALGLAGNAAKDFETAFTGVRKTVDASPAEFAALEQGIRKMALEIPVAATELSMIGEIAGQLGIKKEGILDFTRTIAQLGVTTNLSSEEAAVGLARFINISDATQAEVGNLGSAIVALGNNSATSEKEILNMATRMALAGTQAGLSSEEILAFSASLSSAGVSAELGGTNFSKFISTVNSAVIEGKDNLRSLAAAAGMSAADFKKAFQEDAAGAITTLLAGFDKVAKSGGDVTGLLDDLDFKAEETQRAILALSTRTDDLTGSLNLSKTAFSENIALTKEAELRFATTESQMALFSNTIRDIGISIGAALLPALNSLLGAIKPVLAGFADFAREHSTVTAAAVAIAAGLSTLAIGFGGVLLAAGSLAGSVTTLLPLLAGAGGLGGVVATVGAALTAFATGPIGITAAAIAGLVVGGLALADGFGVLDPILAAVGSAFDAMGSAASAVVENWKPLIVGIGVFAAEIAEKALPGISSLVGWLGDKLGGVFEWLSGVVGAFVDIHLKALGTVFGWVAEQAKALFKFFVDKGEKALGRTGKAFTTTAKTMDEFGKELEGIEGDGSKAKKGIDAAGAAVLNLGSKVAESKDKAYSLSDAVRIANAEFANMENMARGAAQAMADDFDPAAVKIITHLEDVQWEANQASAVIASWGTTVVDTWDSAAMGAAAASNEVKAAFKAMGVSTKAELDQSAADAERNFDLIAGSGQASAQAIDAAWIKMLEARKAALIANGTDLGVEEQKILDNLKARQQQHATDTRTIWETWADGLKGAVANLDIGGKIFSGAFAPGKWKETLKGIGEDFLNVFVQPLKDAVNDLITGVLTKLSDKLKDIGTDAVFGSSSGGDGVLGSVLGGASSGGGTAASASSGLFNQVTGAITAGATVVDAILSHFGRKRAESTANAIEENTRTHMLLFADYRQSVGFFQNDELQKQTGNLEYIVANTDDMKGTLWQIRDALAGGIMVAGLAAGLGTSPAAAMPPIESLIAGSTEGSAGRDDTMFIAIPGDSGMPTRARSSGAHHSSSGGGFGAPSRSRTGQTAAGTATQAPWVDATTFASFSVEDRQKILDLANEMGRLADIFGPGVQASAGAGLSQTADIAAFLDEIGFNDQATAIEDLGSASDRIADLLSDPLVIESPSLLASLSAIQEALQRDLVVNLDGREIARVVGDYQAESLPYA